MSPASGRAPSRPLVAAAVSAIRPALIGVALISGLVNVLALAAPLFMLQVYDRVLTSRSVPTLLGLALLTAGLYAFQAIFDALRARILLRAGEIVDRHLSAPVHAAIVAAPVRGGTVGDGLQPLRDLDTVRGFFAGQAPGALFDLPWLPFYLGLCFLLHSAIGLTALAGALLLVLVTLLTDRLTDAPSREVIARAAARNACAEAGRRNAEVVAAMGLTDTLAQRWQAENERHLAANRVAGDAIGGLAALARALRLALQSAILAVGAWLVLEQAVSAGVMIASSILMGRALAPVDKAIGSWRSLVAARQSWHRLRGLLDAPPPAAPATALPRPCRDLHAETITLAPPGARQPTVSGVSFRLEAGRALGVIGASGSGKSTLARALVGIWRGPSCRVRLDGADLTQWDAATLGRHIGYLPQDVQLFAGSVADNIARMSEAPDAEAILRAARLAGAHDMIVRLPHGYDTAIGEAGAALSAGQRQRIGLARALYGEPFLVVLDEPNAHLDAEGEAAVVGALTAIKAAGGIAVVVAHRPSAMAVVDAVLVMEAGRMKAFGPRDAVLGQVLRRGDSRAAPPLRVVATDGGEPTDVVPETAR